MTSQACRPLERMSVFDQTIRRRGGGAGPANRKRIATGRRHGDRYGVGVGRQGVPNRKIVKLGPIFQPSRPVLESVMCTPSESSSMCAPTVSACTAINASVDRLSRSLCAVPQLSTLRSR
jgi:hypothetical protein